MSGPGRGEVEFAGVGGTMLAGSLVGAGETGSALLLHGLTAHRKLVLMGSRLLEKSGVQTFSFDARGHGESSPPNAPSGWSYGDLRGDAVSACEAVGFVRPVVAGVSMGAHTAAAMELEDPGSCAGLVLITPAFDPDESPETERWSALADSLEIGGIDGFVERLTSGLGDGQWQETVAAAARQRMEKHADETAIAAALRAVPQSRPFESWDDLTRIECPTVIIGSRDEADPHHHLATAERWSEAIPQAVLLVEGEGESPLAWRGASIAAEILRVVEATASG